MKGRPPQFVAIKVLTTYTISPENYGGSKETHFHTMLSCGNDRHRGYSHCAPIYGSFMEKSEAHGDHQCIVLAPLGPSLASLSTLRGKYPLNVVKSITKQILLGLEYMHSDSMMHLGGSRSSNFDSSER